MVVCDGALEVYDAFEYAAADAVVGNRREPLDHVEAGRGGGREVQMEASVRTQPASYGGLLLEYGWRNCRQIEVETGRGLPTDQLDKAEQLATAIARHSRPDHSGEVVATDDRII